MSNHIHAIASEALKYLAETDEDCANAKAHMRGMEYAVKHTASQQTLCAEAKTASERKCVAEDSQAFRDVAAKHVDAIKDYELLAMKRATQLARFEWARSLNANHRQGGGNL